MTGNGAGGPIPSEWLQPGVLSRLLLYGDPATRQSMAAAIGEGSTDLVGLLADTARSREGTALRARCVEVLGLALGTAGPEMTQRILSALVGGMRPT